MQIKKNKEIKPVIEKIIKDHLNYSCSINTYNIFSSTEKEIGDNMSIRKRLILYIKKNESHEAYYFLKEHESLEEELFNKLAKLSFIDFIINNKVQEGIDFANNHMNSLNDKPLLSLIGYGTNNKEEFNKLCDIVNRDEIISRINGIFFKKFTGRTESLLHSTVVYYNTLRHNE